MGHGRVVERQKQDNSEEVREWRRCRLVSVVADATIGLGGCFECWDLCSLEGGGKKKGKKRACGRTHSDPRLVKV